MRDSTARVAAHTAVLVEYSAAVQPGETVALNATTLATPLVEALFTRVLERGGHPTAFVTPPRLEEIFLRVARDEQLRHPPFFLEVGLDYFDHIITILAPENTRYASSVDPQRQVLMAQGRAPLMDKYMAKLLQPTRSITITAHPTAAAAQDAAMSLLDYEDFFYHACLLDEPEPAAAWRAMAARQEHICTWLQTKSTMRVQGPTVDLTLAIGGRQWINGDGHKNFPCGEIFTSPLEDSAHGHIRFTYPATHQGREARDVQLWFEHGRVVRAEAATGNEFLQEMLATDDGARRVGEIAIGTNRHVKRFTGNTLFDEKMGGTCHLAIGRSLPLTGGHNVSAIHWDMVCDLRTSSTLTADGDMFYRNGEFTLP